MSRSSTPGSGKGVAARLVPAAVLLLSVLSSCAFSPSPAADGALPWRREAPSSPAADWNNAGYPAGGGPGACPMGGGWQMAGGPRHHHGWEPAGSYRQPPPAGGNAAARPEPQSPGAILVSHYCAQCHARPSPQQHTAVEWPAVVSRMRGHMQAMSNRSATLVQPPSTVEIRDILTYLQTHAR